MSAEAAGWVALWLLGCAACGFVAQMKGRHTVAWFGLALLASPVLVGIVVLLIPPVAKTPPDVDTLQKP